MKEIVLVRLAIDPQAGAIDPTAPFVVIPRQRELQRLPGRGELYEKEPAIIAQIKTAGNVMRGIIENAGQIRRQSAE
jgi:hypothetical protein